MKKFLLTLVICLFATASFSHSKVDSTVPANGAELSAVPDTVTFNFAKGMRLTKVEMTHAAHPAVVLDLEGISGFQKEIMVPLNNMGAGAYVIEWRGLGVDGHVVKGSFAFEVN